MNYNEQVQMFKSRIPIGLKSSAELIEYLKQKAEIKEILPSDLPGKIMQTAVDNASHCILNENLQLKADDMSFLVFQVIQGKNSSPYYSDISQDEDFIYVIFERSTGYITSNSNQLFLELELARGVTQHEYDTEGSQFRSLISHLAIAYCAKSK